MGMVSYTDWCELRLKDGKKEDFLKWLDNHEDWKEITEIKNNEVYFNQEWKIISYWYPSFLQELKEINQFIEGDWALLYETGEEKAIIHFKNSGVEIEEGVMEWRTYKLEELLKEEEKLREVMV